MITQYFFLDGASPSGDPTGFAGFTGHPGLYLFDGFSPSDAVAEPEPSGLVERGKRGRRYRIIEDPDRILEEVRREEKKVAKDKKQLVILERRASSPNVEGALYQQIQAKVEKLEAKIDDRMERIAFLMASLDLEDDDDEEVLLMS